MKGSEYIGSYPSIYALGHSALGADFLGRDLIVQEKVDGSQFSVMRTEDGWSYKSKGVQVFKENAPALFKPTVNYFESLDQKTMDLVPMGAVLRGEAFCSVRHNTLKYGRIPRGHFVLFDVELTGGQYFMNPLGVGLLAERLGVEPVRTIHEGPVSLEMLNEYLKMESFLGGTTLEGVVIKPKNYDLYGADKKVLLAKLVRADFVEENHKAFKESNPSGQDVVKALIAKYRVEARWKKAVQHLRDAGKLEGSPRDIGALVKEIQNDILKEESEAIAAALMKRFAPDVIRGASAGAAEWYKAYLLENMNVSNNPQETKEEVIDQIC